MTKQYDLSKIEDIKRLFQDEDFVKLFNKYGKAPWNVPLSRLDGVFNAGKKINDVYSHDGYLAWAMNVLPATFLKNIFGALNAYGKAGNIIYNLQNSGFKASHRVFNPYGFVFFGVIQSLRDMQFKAIQTEDDRIFLARRILQPLGEIAFLGSSVLNLLTDRIVDRKLPGIHKLNTYGDYDDMIKSLDKRVGRLGSASAALSAFAALLFIADGVLALYIFFNKLSTTKDEATRKLYIGLIVGKSLLAVGAGIVLLSSIFEFITTAFSKANWVINAAGELKNLAIGPLFRVSTKLAELSSTSRFVSLSSRFFNSLGSFVHSAKVMSTLGAVGVGLITVGLYVMAGFMLANAIENWGKLDRGQRAAIILDFSFKIIGASLMLAGTVMLALAATIGSAIGKFTIAGSLIFLMVSPVQIRKVIDLYNYAAAIDGYSASLEVYGFDGYKTQASIARMQASQEIGFIVVGAVGALIGIAMLAMAPVTAILVGLFVLAWAIGMTLALIFGGNTAIVNRLYDEYKGVLKKYGSLEKYFDKSFEAEANRIVESAAFKQSIISLATTMRAGGFDRLLMLISLDVNDLQYKDGVNYSLFDSSSIESLDPFQNWALDIDLSSNIMGQLLTKSIFNVNTIDLTSTAKKQYVAAMGVLYSPSTLRRYLVQEGFRDSVDWNVRQGGELNINDWAIKYESSQWEIVDGSTSTTIVLRDLLAASQPNNTDPKTRAKLSLGGGHDTVIAGPRHFDFDGGTGFNGVDYSDVFVRKDGVPNRMVVTQASDGSIKVEKSGYGEFAVETIEKKQISGDSKGNTKYIEHISSKFERAIFWGMDNLKNVQWIAGSIGDDTFYGGDPNNFFVASYGNDSYSGGGGVNYVDYSALVNSANTFKVGVTAALDRDGFKDYIAPLYDDKAKSDDAVNKLMTKYGVVQGSATYFFDRQRVINPLTNIDNLRGTINDDTLVGNDLANTFESVGGNDRLIGKGGNDQFIMAHFGNATVDGGSGTDMIDYSETNLSYTVTLRDDNTGKVSAERHELQGSVIIIETPGLAKFSEIEVYSRGVNITRDASDVRISALDGNETFFWNNDGRKLVDGQLFSSGSIENYIDNEISVIKRLEIRFNDDVVIDEVRLFGSRGSAGSLFNGLTNDVSHSGIVIYGSQLNRSIYYQGGGAKVEFLPQGYVYMQVRADDIKTHLNGGALHKIVKNDELNNIENIRLGGGNDKLTGNLKNNFLDVGSGDDTVESGGGNDTVLAGTGSDDISLGNGDDLVIIEHKKFEVKNGKVIYELKDEKNIKGGEGVDSVDYSKIDTSDLTGVSISLIDDKARYLALTGVNVAGHDTLTSIEAAIGSVGNDILLGDMEGNQLDGHLGDDYLDGNAGMDVIFTGWGKDTVLAGSGDDFIYATEYVGGYVENFKGYLGREKVDLFREGFVRLIDFSSVANSVTLFMPYKAATLPSDKDISATFKNIKKVESGSLLGSEAGVWAHGYLGEVGKTEIINFSLHDNVNGGISAFLKGKFSIGGDVSEKIDDAYLSRLASRINSKTSGRYVYIRKNPGMINNLILAEVEVISNGINIARNKMVDSSPSHVGSTPAEYYLHRKWNAVDGYVGGNMVSDGIFASESVSSGWLEIDLGSIQDFDEIKIYGRTDQWSNQNGDFSVFVADTSMKERYIDGDKGWNGGYVPTVEDSLGSVLKYVAAGASKDGVVSIKASDWSIKHTDFSGIVGWWLPSSISASEGDARMRITDLSLQMGSHAAAVKDIQGGEGRDTLSYQYRNSEGQLGISASLRYNSVFTAKNRKLVSASVYDKISGVENLMGTQFDDFIEGNWDINSLSGQAGDDDIQGLDGDDYLGTGIGKDTVAGGGGHDMIFVNHAGPKPKGRFVMIRKNADVQNHLVVAEVEIIAAGKNVAKGKIVVSSGSFQGDVDLHKASNAVDGKTSGTMIKDGIFASATLNEGWLQVDLGTPTDIDQIIIYGRTDSYSGQNGDFMVYVSDTDMSNKTTDSIRSLSDTAYVKVIGQRQRVDIDRMTGFLVDPKDIDGGEGVDTVDYSDTGGRWKGVGILATLDDGNGKQTVSTWFEGGTVKATSATDVLRNIERVIGTVYGDSLAGDATENMLDGGAGDDSLMGMGGDDVLITGSGKDTVRGGAGRDTIQVEGRATEVQSASDWLRFAGTTFMNTGRVDFIDLDSPDNALYLDGGYIDKPVKAQVRTVDVSVRGVKSFWAVGIDGIHTKAVKVVLTDDAKGGVTASIKEAKYVEGDETAEGFDWNTQGQTISLTDSNSENGYGVSSMRLAYYSYAGNAKTIDGGDGDDVVSYVRAPLLGITGIDGSLATGEVNTWFRAGDSAFKSKDDQLFKRDKLVNVEGLVGTDNADRLEGSESDDMLHGAGGSDSLVGGAGDDSLFTGVGKDTVDAGAGNDVISVSHDTLTPKGRYVMIRKNADVQNHLVVAEIEVFAAGKNVAKDKQVVSSGGFQGDVDLHKAFNAVDGKTSGAMIKDGIFASATLNEGWLQVDLGTPTDIDQIIIYGRTDSYSGQNGNFTVYVSNTNMAGLKKNQIEALADVSLRRVSGEVKTMGIMGMATYTDGKTINGGAGIDKVDYLGGGVNGVGIDGSLLEGKVNTWFEDAKVNSRSVQDILVNIENLAGTSAADKLTGNHLDNTLIGYDGDDLLEGGAGNDSLFTGGGQDKVVAGEGNDDIFVAHQGPKPKGRYLMIRKNVDTQINLSIAEVEVFKDGTNIAKDKPVTSSGSFTASEPEKHKASNAVDGKLGGVMIGHGIFSSAAMQEGWLQVDLGSSQSIDNILIHGRTDAGADQNGNYTVYLSETNMNNKTRAEIEALSDLMSYRHVGQDVQLIIERMENYFVDVKDIDGGDGKDTLIYQGNSVSKIVGIHADLGRDKVEAWYERGNAKTRSLIDKVKNIENVVGTNAADVLIGNDEANELHGAGGDDSLVGGAGEDVLVTGAGKDTVQGGGDDDAIQVDGRVTETQSASGWLRFAGTTFMNTGRVDFIDLDSPDNALYLDGGYIDKPVKAQVRTVDVSVRGVKSFWAVGIDGIHTKAVKVVLTDDAKGGVTASIKEAKYVEGDETAEGFDWNTQGQTISLTDSNSENGYGVSSMRLAYYSYAGNAKTIDGGDGDDVVSYVRAPLLGITGIDGSLATGEVNTWFRAGDSAFKSKDDQLFKRDKLVNVEGLVGTNNADMLTGNDGNNELVGAAGNDTIDGGAGDDVLYTGLGVDQLIGGAGDDTIHVEHDGATPQGRFILIRKNPGVKKNLVIAEVSVLKQNVNLALNAKVTSSARLTQLGPQNQASNVVDGKMGGLLKKDGLFVSESVDAGWLQIDLGSPQTYEQIMIYGAEESADSWSAHNGDYTVYLSNTDMQSYSVEEIEGLYKMLKRSVPAQVSEITIDKMEGFYTDTKMIDGGVGMDTVSYGFISAVKNVGISASLEEGMVKTWYQGEKVKNESVIDTLKGIENLIGTSSHDVIVGDGGNNRLSGLGGDDLLDGGDGEDSLRTGMGKDSVLGGAGNDVIFIDHERPDVSWTIKGWLSFKGNELSTKGKVADINFDSPTNSITLDGVYASSQPKAYARLVDKNVKGRVTFWAVALDGIYTKAVKVLLMDTAGGGGVAFLQEAKFADGNQLDTMFDWNKSGNSISSTELAGGVGYGISAMSLVGKMSYYTDAKNIHGGEGVDTVSYDALSNQSGAGISALLDDGKGNGSVHTWFDKGSVNSNSVVDKLVSIENLIGTENDDKIVGGAGDNQISGGGGSDSIEGGAGKDHLYTGAGRDTVLGGGGNDVIHMEHQVGLASENYSVLRGRYVLVRHMLGNTRALAMTEVSVWVKGENVALRASVQVQTSKDGVWSTSAAKNVVDSKLVNQGAGSDVASYVSQASDGTSWLMIDLGQSYNAIDAIDLVSLQQDPAKHGPMGSDIAVFVSNSGYENILKNLQFNNNLLNKGNLQMYQNLKNITQYIELPGNNVGGARILGSDGRLRIYDHEFNNGFYTDWKTVDGGDGEDMVSYRRIQNAGVYIQLKESGQSETYAKLGRQLRSGWLDFSQEKLDSFKNVENLGGTETADRLDGNSADNQLMGFGGNDTINGNGGDDVIFTGAGKDIIRGNDGDDVIFSEQDLAVLEGRYVLVRHLPNVPRFLVLEKISIWSGDKNLAFDAKVFTSQDELYRNWNPLNLVNGSKQTYHSDAADGSSWAMIDLGQSHKIDRIDVRAVNSRDHGPNGADIGLFVSDIDMRGFAADYDRLIDHRSVRYAELPGGTFNGVRNVLSPTGQLSFGVERFMQSKTIDGGAGEDTVSYRLSNGAKDVGIVGDLSKQTVNTWYKTTIRDGARLGEILTGSSIDNLSAIENLCGTDANDVLFGNSDSNKLYGYDGDDYLNGDGSNLIGSSGSDYLAGGEGSDTYYVPAQWGADKVYEQEGVDSTDKDTVYFDSKISYSDLLFNKVNESMVISRSSATSNLLVIDNWYNDSKSRVEEIVSHTTDGKRMVLKGHDQIQRLVDELAKFKVSYESPIASKSTLVQGQILSAMGSVWKLG